MDAITAAYAAGGVAVAAGIATGAAVRVVPGVGQGARGAGGEVMEDELRERVAKLEDLVMRLAEKLATVAEHLGRLSERKDVRRGQGRGD